MVIGHPLVLIHDLLTAFCRFVGDQQAAAANQGDTLVHVKTNKVKRKRKKGGAPDSDEYMGKMVGCG